MADNFGLKIGVEGEKEFKKALAEINQNFKVLGSEMKLVSSQFDKNDNSVQALSARNTVLNKEIDAQKQKIETLRQALANASESFGETDRRTQSWQIQLNNAQALLNGMERELNSNNSANDYMETVTGFSASLIQSLGGDTDKSVKYVDMAITDMADNANKMGTDMSLIQNAYQGFAKQNYTMLDNLKLGYGGTKEEMQRLLSDAEKISGVKYDISSYADVVDAIHVMQESMDIADTTAKEVNAQLGLGSSKPATSKKTLYRVRKSWKDAKSQKGAFYDLSNAKKCADKNSGYSVFDESGKSVYTPKSSGKKSVDAIAKEVIQGKWDNGADRKKRLTKAGYDYNAIQERVNEILS